MHAAKSHLYFFWKNQILKIHVEEEEVEKLALFMKRIINFQEMIRCKEVLLRKDWRIISLLLVLHRRSLKED